MAVSEHPALFDLGSADCFQLSNFPVVELLCPSKGDKIHRVKIDTADLPKVLAVSTRWRVANFYPRGFRLYAYIGRWVKGSHTTVYLHRVVTGAPAGMEVDHANHNSLDNRTSCNLRVVTHKENLNNRVDHQRKRRMRKILMARTWQAEMFGGKQ